MSASTTLPRYRRYWPDTGLKKLTPFPSESPTGQRLSMKCWNPCNQDQHTIFVDSAVFGPILYCFAGPCTGKQTAGTNPTERSLSMSHSMGPIALATPVRRHPTYERAVC